ncbi:H-2 class I histocompatibility antigen, alpha chain-like [Ambystoma mexicanum]|uniref:H-2 class I histocompatibility antigen, alpha chain-like n=1 Tax=Ambystoma mexicanum TaxID=8296 RepID=UPI0037E8A4CE
MVLSRIDYCNSLYLAQPKGMIKRLQQLQNLAARVATGSPFGAHISPVLRNLHWLPVAQRVEFKTLCIVHRAIHGPGAEYLQAKFMRYCPLIIYAQPPPNNWLFKSTTETGLAAGASLLLQQFCGIILVNVGKSERSRALILSSLPTTPGLHTLQEMYGCELRGDGAIGGFYEYAYDGGDYLSFDKDEMRFRATAAPAQISADTWNLDKIQAQREKAYLEGTCIEWLRKYLRRHAPCMGGGEPAQERKGEAPCMGEKTLLRRVPPGTMVSRRKSGDRTLLTCYVYGFYPREIEVKWIRSGVEMPLEWSQLLPNPDGTYQIKATVEVQEGDEKNMYDCQVEHSSLPEIVTVVYEEKSPGPSIGLIAGVILAVVLAVGVAAFGVWYAFFRDKHPGGSNFIYLWFQRKAGIDPEPSPRKQRSHVHGPKCEDRSSTD